MRSGPFLSLKKIQRLTRETFEFDPPHVHVADHIPHFIEVMLMQKKILISLLSILFPFLLVSCFQTQEKAKAGNSQHLDIQKEGITIDAKYDPRLDNLIPGYKILTVGLTNNGVDILRLNPLKDRWEIVDAYGRNRRAVNSLRIREPAIFSRLPDHVQQLIEYPVGVSVGYSETIDLFFPVNQDLHAFRSISFYCAERKQNFDILANLENSNQQPIEAIEKQIVPPVKKPTNKKH
jgi:hypothetical protein